MRTCLRILCVQRERGVLHDGQGDGSGSTTLLTSFIFEQLGFRIV
jgi:hypothetical protein